MKITIISTFPQLHETFFTTSLIARAVEKKLISYNLIRFSDFCQPKERIDEPTCGPGPGMIIKPEITQKALEHCYAQWGKGFTIFFSPQGKKLDQPLFRQLAASFTEHTQVNANQSSENDAAHPEPHIILVCPRYEGVDSRVEAAYADLVLSVGDYVLMGGDIPAQLFLEGLLRLLPEVVGNVESLEQESFESPFFDHPQFGLPLEWKGNAIPALMTSGNHAAINKWRKEEAARKTVLNRFDWFREHSAAQAEQTLVKKLIPNHYVCLMHSQVIVKSGSEGTTSITSIDIHDLARSSSTYGVNNVFIVSPLEDQQSIIGEFLAFWHSAEGAQYNQTRHNAVSRVIPTRTFEQVIAEIEKREGIKPLIIATSAKPSDQAQTIDYHSQGKVWQHNRPVLFVFGTGQGLAPSLLEQCDYLLIPVYGMTNYNHLSVRSAVAIILDRWFGLNPRIR